VATLRLNEKEILKALNRLNRPVSASELAEEFDVSGQTIGRYLYNLGQRGAAMKVTTSQWVGDNEIVRGLVQAYPTLIAWYRRRNPSQAEFLMAEWKDLIAKGFK